MFCPKSLPSLHLHLRSSSLIQSSGFSESNEFRCKSKQCWSLGTKTNRNNISFHLDCINLRNPEWRSFCRGFLYSPLLFKETFRDVTPIMDPEWFFKKHTSSKPTQGTKCKHSENNNNNNNTNNKNNNNNNKNNKNNNNNPDPWSGIPVTATSNRSSVRK